MKKDTFRILLVEDDPDDQFFIQGGIRAVNSDIQIISVYNGIQAMDYLLNNGCYKDILTERPDMIITDLNMPICSGLELLRLLKKYKDLNDIPAFILSTSTKEWSINDCLELGAIKHFKKPNLSELYIGIIEEMVSITGFESKILATSHKNTR